ncbi:MAG: hypothetical protein WEA56_06655 [Balneolaceae bacterium]
MNTSNQKPVRPALFWSGGKDSFLALRVWQQSGKQEPFLFTTYDDESGIVPFQQIPIKNIYRQSVHLELPLLAVPVSYPVTNQKYLEVLQQVFNSAPFQVKDTIFGDLHLQDIRDWREQQFTEMDIKTHFPIWHKTPDQLLRLLEKEPAEIYIRSVTDEFKDEIKPGDLFNREFVKSLPGHVDPFGEKGEFHTEVVFV